MLKLTSSIALMLIFGIVVKTTPTGEQNGYTAGNGGTTQGIKAKKIQIVYIKVPLSKVLQNPNNGYNSGGNTGERGYSEGGGGGSNGVGRGFEGSSGVPGEGRVPNYGNNNIGVAGNVGEGYRGRGFAGNDNYGASTQNNYNTGKLENNGEGGIVYDNEEGTNGGGFASGGGTDNLNYQNDANLGMAYGAAVGNALPQNVNYEESANYGQESQNSGYTQSNQIGFGQNEGYGQSGQNDGYGQSGQNGGYAQITQNNGYEQNGQNANGGYEQQHNINGAFGENYEKGKLHKGNQHYPKMIAIRPQMPIMATFPSFAMKGFSSPSFSGASFPSFGGKGFGGPSFGGIGQMPGISAMSGISGITGMSGFGGIKNKLSMFLGNKFGMGGGGGLLGGMMGWD